MTNKKNNDQDKAAKQKTKCPAGCANGKVQKYDERTGLYKGWIGTCPTCNGTGEV